MISKYKIPFFAALALTLLLSGCVTKKYDRPNVKTEDLFRDLKGTDTVTMATMPWEELFADAKLKALISKGLAQNVDLKNAIENIVQAQATLKQSKLGYYPTLSANADITHAKQSKAALNFPAGININTLTDVYRAYLSTSWEADIWGKISSTKRMALASYLQTDAAKRAVQTQLISDIANNYYALVAYDEQLRITEQTLKSRIDNIEIVNALKEAAIVNGAAVVQAEANRYAAEVTIPDLKLSIRQTENALCILLGQAPGPIDRTTLEDQTVPQTLAVGVPSQLLENRPDVQQAEMAFRNAFENVNLAKTYFYPSLTLTANGGASTLSLDSFFKQSIFYSIVGSLTQPIFNRGLNKQRLTTAQSQQVQALNNFQQTIFVAGQEISNALYSYEMAVSKQESRVKQVEALTKAVDYTEQLLQYTSTTNYTDVLTSQQSLLAAQLSGVNDKLQQLQAVVNLYRALGGGWQ
ncbi:TolC family protein [Flavobacterium subsaxonicum]|uniref:Membrane protein n=1 Tax=Flavobacterium subsaxonicum WB 4.1-42 = DSM 21790 TaxID=1121898 RepID=A0A0A2MTM1_9FLAO|nr:TolC family protein [Flavobacterium subsaxonicum]KGO91580.1 membrane protein [Flavobacterium subsaxonicum WB 4.1-42 = DSM 21790]